MSVRDAVTARTVGRVEQWPVWELGVRGGLDTSGFSSRDAALAHAIDHAVARRWLTLERVVRSEVVRSWEQVESGVRAALLVGAAQLLLLEKLPDHAVIHEAVAWTKRHVRPGAGGFVNAVLRKVAGLRVERVEVFDDERRDQMPLSEGGAWVLSGEVFPESALARLGEQTSHPSSVIEGWVMQLGWSGARELAMHNLVIPPVIVTGVEGSASGFEAHDEPGFLVSVEDRADLSRLFERQSLARVQDPGTAAACELTRGVACRLIVDVCAGRGTKTKQLCELHPSARIVATDTDEVRLGDLRRVFAGSAQVEVVAFGELSRYQGGADCVVLDVPCSNSGVLARRVEAKYRLSGSSLAQLSELQRGIIERAMGLLKLGGHMLYATCSLEPAENSSQVAWMKQQFGLNPVAGESRFPRGLPGGVRMRYADGGFGCLLQR